MSTDKEQKAFRVMEALSAADEELLERCERSDASAGKGEKGNRGKIYLFVRRHGRGCAACLSLLLIGAAYFGLTQTRGEIFGGSGGSSDNMMPLNNAAQEEQKTEHADGGIDLPAEEGYKADEPMEEAAGEACPAETPEWLDVDQLAGSSAVTVQNPLTTERAEEGRTDGFGDGSGSTPGSQQEKMVQTEKKIASEARVPEGYSSVIQEEGGEEWSEADGLLFEWSDGAHTLWLKMTQTELTADMRFDTVPPVYTVREEWRNLIPQADEQGLVQFALLREDGVLVEYRGVLAREEIIALFESVLTAE